MACHNPHRDQRNHPVVIDGDGKLNTAIRRPSHYQSTLAQDQLWGDDASERMDQYASQFTNGFYQAPYYGSFGSGQYEPSGNASPSDGSDLPDYVTFCLDCHQYEQYDPERSDEVKAISWTSKKHGGGAADKPGDTVGVLMAPYSDDSPDNYVLCCTDCHEPHGTPNRQHLLRRFVNGTLIPAETIDQWCEITPDEARPFCQTCHTVDMDHFPSIKCFGCHNHNGTF